MSKVLLEAREKARGRDLATIPAPLTQQEYVFFTHFVELLLPLCELTDAVQGDKITAPLLIPTLKNTFISEFFVLSTATLLQSQISNKLVWLFINLLHT